MVSALGFRPDVQGLRALAVLLVIAGHLGGLGLPGGFIGVDVFFVVSGFLITLLLLREVAEQKSVSLIGFYARRARRILPAATVVIVATVVGSLLLLPLTRIDAVMGDAVWTSLFLANVRFAQTDTDYFAEDQAASPLQHFWSLSVEEQFYLFWPLVVLLWAWWAHRRMRQQRLTSPGREAQFPLFSLAVVLALGCVASLVWSVHATDASPATAYFSTFTRTWELGSGAAAAVLVAAGWSIRSRALRTLVGLVGLVAIGAGALLFDAATPFPGTAALVPVLGAVALLVSGGAGAGTVVTGLLSLRPLRAIGDWSYSLYLWHWPAIILVQGRWGDDVLDPLGAKAALVAGVFVLSWASYRWVETPFRRGTFWRPNWRSVLVYPVSVALVAVAATVGPPVLGPPTGGTGSAIALPDATSRLDARQALVKASVEAARADHAIPAQLDPTLSEVPDAIAPLACDYAQTRDLCPLGDVDSTVDVVLIGDSHARAWSPAFETLAAEHGVRLHSLVLAGCHLRDPDRNPRQEAGWENCVDFLTWSLDQVKKIEPDLVLVTTSSPGSILMPSGDVVARSDQANYPAPYRDELREPLETLVAHAGRVVAFSGTPRFTRDPGDCLSQRDATLGDCLFQTSDYFRSLDTGFQEVAEAAGAEYIDVNDLFCWDGDCPAVIGDNVVQRDTHHVTPEYAVALAEELGKRIGRPFVSSPRVPTGATSVGAATDTSPSDAKQ